MSFNFGTPANPSDAILSLNNPNAALAVRDNATNTTSNSAPVIFRVVSQNPIQTSRVFKAALTGPWKEGSAAEDGDKNLEAEGWDSEAMHIVLSAIHHRTRNIPRKVTPEMLCNIVVLVDYYELHDTMYFFLDTWIYSLRYSIPRTYDRDLVLWICMTSVFTSPDIHKTVMNVAISHCQGEFQPLDLPIPERVIDHINTQREAALKQFGTALDDMKGKASSGYGRLLV
ncbi:hypothetical protein B0T18DRAFT_432578 [Schizothecium vesticola]|uniref:BTB domain-containing protein n=1 Tax=Schizothecium vesticola TaxID=314040 RepID=A0AA40ELD8_9PEZI|nr:hypothetical protein B0T18DRAFT_432578 [Schizothecium vesticola]